MCRRYLARIRPAPELHECADGRGTPEAIRRAEAARLLLLVPDGAILVALDKGGRSPASEAFAASVDTWLGSSRPVAFVLGGAEGLDRSVLDRADTVLSFGPQTWPHMLARVMLLEQLWRARAISAGHPYHRA